MSSTGQSRETAEVRALLVARAEALARELVPDGRRQGQYWMGRNPTRADRNGGSFWVRLDSGAWKDEATGDTGDVFKLIAYVCVHATFRDTLAWARGFLGLGAMPADERRRVAAAAGEAQQQREAERAEQLAKWQRAASAIYFSAKRSGPIAGSPVGRYLNGRGIDIAALSRVPGALGWLPDGVHRQDTDDVSRPIVTRWPTMVAAFTGDDNRIVAVHRTWIAPDGGGKAPVDPPRKIWPSFSGAAIRLWRGDSNLSVDDAAKQGLIETLILTEGVEDGLSIALAMPDHRIWCAGSLGNLASIKLPACVDRVIVCKDNDWGKRQAQAQFDKAVAALAAQGREVCVASSMVGKDANDALRGAA